RVRALQIITRYSVGNRVEIILQGDPTEINMIVMELKRLAKIVKETSRKGVGMNVYDVNFLLNTAKLEAAIPLEVVFTILELLGYRVDFRENKLKTDAPLEKVLEVMSMTSRVYREMMSMNVTPQAKRIIAMYVVVKGRDIEKSIDDLINLNLLNKHEELNLIVLTHDYEKSVKMLKEKLKS
ncbi:MAG: hypothetical protein B6V02_04095, partial [Thermoprotei archaeon ex4572_64]